jgi:hypothetical protein
MSIRHLFSGLLAGVALLAAGSAAEASDCSCAPVAAPAPCYKTVTVTEWFPVQYEATRTVYKTEYVTENYTAYRYECVPETRTFSHTIYKSVPTFQQVVRTTYKCVPTVETRTVMHKQVVCRQVTTMKCKTVDKGHYECCTKELGPSLHDRLRMHHDCCYVPCPRYKTKKVWVPCLVTVETPCTKTVREVVCVPQTVCVTVNKMVPVQETVQVCVQKCVPEVVTSTATVYVKKCVAVPATRCVARCVPVVEKYTACRLECRTVSKEVPACECSVPCCKRHGFRLWN